MATLAELLLEKGIRPRRYSEGNQTLLCPRCSHTRKNRSDPCLSLTIDGDKAVWNCKNGCGFVGAVSEGETETTRSGGSHRRTPPTRPKRAPDEPTAAVFAWLAGRGISEATARRNRIGAERVYVSALRAETECIAFPYFRNGELVNIKFRALASKDFTQVKGAEAVLYGLDDIADSKAIIIVEGEPDKLACEEAGLRNVVSVPNGAQTGGKADTVADSAAFVYLANCADHLDRAERIVLAVDNDEKGRILETEFFGARRSGRLVRLRTKGFAQLLQNDVSAAGGVISACAQAETMPSHIRRDAAQSPIEIMTGSKSDLAVVAGRTRCLIVAWADQVTP
jgi:twinkle protein